MSRTVLYVESDSQNLPLIKWALASLATQILWAGDGAAALEIAVAHHPDLILVDARLTDMEAGDLIYHLRGLGTQTRHAVLASVPILLLTTNLLGRDAERAAAAGCTAAIAKPINVRDLWQQVQALLPGRGRAVLRHGA
jgi:two-component system cell cycle response regulator DivK